MQGHHGNPDHLVDLWSSKLRAGRGFSAFSQRLNDFGPAGADVVRRWPRSRFRHAHHPVRSINSTPVVLGPRITRSEFLRHTKEATRHMIGLSACSIVAWTARYSTNVVLNLFQGRSVIIRSTFVLFRKSFLLRDFTPNGIDKIPASSCASTVASRTWATYS